MGEKVKKESTYSAVYWENVKYTVLQLTLQEIFLGSWFGGGDRIQATMVFERID